jgi:hypothetical protein
MPWRNQWEGIGGLKRTSYLQLSITRLIVAFEILNRPLVLFGGGARAKGTQVSPPAGLGIFLS